MFGDMAGGEVLGGLVSGRANGGVLVFVFVSGAEAVLGAAIEFEAVGVL